MEEINIFKRKKERTLARGSIWITRRCTETKTLFFLSSSFSFSFSFAWRLRPISPSHLLLNPLNPRFDLGFYLSIYPLPHPLSEKDLSISVAESLKPWLLPSLKLLIVSFRFTFLDLFFYLNRISIRVFVFVFVFSITLSVTWFDFRQIYIIK